ncbi:MAG: hypothetical protein JO235_09765 [Chroococcidiopsidaceae cyanobacterium CP_BM_RX_35]|nr:hypothetical protein [Chroococcidiopsidaceae cyanobacterium CP_BM_RX_35]
MSFKDFFSDLPWLGKSLVILLSSILGVLAIAIIYTRAWVGDLIAHFLWTGVILTGLLLLFVVTIQLTYANNWAGAPIVLKPIHTQGDIVGLIFIQGEGIPIERYCPVARAIQAVASNLEIWVGIPQFIGDSPIPRETGLAIGKVLHEMEREGMPSTNNLFFIAHSVGGIAIQRYLNSFPDDAKGQILMGSFLRKCYLSNLNNQGKTVIQYTVPTLTIGGTLDGLTRITRIAAAFWYQQINSSQFTDVGNFPVIAIDGASHMQFASGEATSYVADFDLKPQIEEDEVHKQVGELVYNFICTKLSDIYSESSLKFLIDKQEKTQQWLQPLLDSFLLEGYNGFKPACYNRAEDNTRTDPKCTPYSPWIQNSANSIMAGRDSSPVKFNLNIIDSFHRSYTTDPFHNPHVHIPQVRNSCNGTEPCTLTISSVTQALYNWLEVFDTGFFPISAFSLRTKLNSRQNIWKHAGVSQPSYTETDGPSRGAEINQYVYKWALEHAGDEVRSYFEKFGIPIEMGEDVVPIVAAGPLWIWNYPKYNYLPLNNNQIYQVRSTVMKTPINYVIPSARGFHYCQLLSPAAAMEWIYIDGLRLKASLSGDTFIYGPLAGIDKVIRFFLRQVLRQTRTKGLLKQV